MDDMSIFSRLLRNLALMSCLLLPFSCMEKEKAVSLGSSLSDKGLSMTSSKSDKAKVEVYLISRDAVEGELLAKALNASGREIGRSKQSLNLGKDDAKLVTFTFDASVNLDEVTKYLIDFRKR